MTIDKLVGRSRDKVKRKKNARLLWERCDEELQGKGRKKSKGRSRSFHLRFSLHRFEFGVRTSWSFWIVFQNPRMSLDLFQGHSFSRIQFQELEDG